MATINKNLEIELKELGLTYSLTNDADYCNDNVEDKDADGMVVYCYDNGLEMYSYKLPKSKEITTEWVMNKWTKSTDTTYTDFAKKFKNILKANGVKQSMNIYPTTYGIGVSVLFSGNKELDIIKEIKSLLEQNDIEYKNSQSEAGWVYQFKISKSQSNLTKIKNVK